MQQDRRRARLKIKIKKIDMFIIGLIIGFVAIMALVIRKASAKDASEQTVHVEKCGCDGNCTCVDKETAPEVVSYPLVTEGYVGSMPTYVDIEVKHGDEEHVLIKTEVTDANVVPEVPKVEEPVKAEVKKPVKKVPAKKAEVKKPVTKKPNNKNKKK